MKAVKNLIIPAALLLLLSPVVLKASGSVKDHQFFSKALKKEMTCRVYLPEVYEPANPDKRFPVIYFLHGASLGYDSYDLLFSILDNLIGLNLIKPVILILPDGLAPPYNGSFYTNSALYGNFEDFISEDLIAFTDSAFHTYSERGKRGIMGASMGAYGALKAAFKNPELYIGAAGHSGPANINMMDNFIPDLISEDGGAPPYHWSPGPGKSLTNLTFSMAGAFSPNLDNIYKVDFPLDSLARPVAAVMQRWKTHNICEIARTLNTGTCPSVRFDCGILDEYYLYYQNRALDDTLTKYNISHKYDEYLGTHTTGLPVRVSLSFSWFDNLFLSTGTGDPVSLTDAGWTVYPNPASGSLNVNAPPGSDNYSGSRFELLDLDARTVLSRRLITNNTRLDVGNLPEGIYYFRIRSGTELQTGRICIVRH